MIIGLTGSIGAGKTTVATLFENFGIAVQSSDAVVHYIYAHDTETIDTIATVFPHVVINNSVNRDLLRQHLHTAPLDKKILEDIVHPRVAYFRREFIKSHNNCVLDVPLLFEADVYKECDTVVVVVAQDSIRQNRVVARGQTVEIFDMFNAIQMPQTQKVTLADFVIYTDTDILETEQQVREIISHLGIGES